MFLNYGVISGPETLYILGHWRVLANYDIWHARVLVYAYFGP